MKWRVELTSSAQRDIAQTLEWTLQHFGKRQLDRYRRMIRATMQQIATDPFGSRGKIHTDLKSSVRCMRIGGRGEKARHLFFYKVHDDGLIVIGRLLHDAMDSARHLPDDFTGDEANVNANQ